MNGTFQFRWPCKPYTISLRQTITFDTVTDLSACLHALVLDSEILVVRLKNMLDEAFDSWSTGGYRSGRPASRQATGFMLGGAPLMVKFISSSAR